MIVLGLVGTPAGGKSTVARTLADSGATWIDADVIAREVLQRSETRRVLVQHFGAEIVGEGGMIDRGKLAAIVFGDDDLNRSALNFLESVVHPPTRLEISDRLRSAASRRVSVAVLDVPLLFESGWDLACDAIWCIDAPLDDRIQRSASRGWDAAELSRRESKQLPIAEKKRLSNRYFKNVGLLHPFIDQIRALYPTLTHASRQSPPDVGHCGTD